LSVSSLLRLKNWSYVEQALAYRISWEMYTPYAGDSGMLLHIYEKLTMVKLKSSRLSYKWVVSFPSASMFSKTSKYEAEVDDFVVSLISSSLGYIESTYEWNWSLLIDRTSSIYLNVELKATARGLFLVHRKITMCRCTYYKRNVVFSIHERVLAFGVRGFNPNTCTLGPQLLGPEHFGRFWLRTSIRYLYCVINSSRIFRLTFFNLAQLLWTHWRCAYDFFKVYRHCLKKLTCSWIFPLVCNQLLSYI
jgi:hypothetical protein